MWSRLLRAAPAGGVLAIAWGSSSCSPTGFASQSLVESVRILASSADEPFAKPGDRVHVTILAFDGRTATQRAGAPMNLTWLPTTAAGQLVPCVDPANDAYYACFPEFRSSISSGVDSGAGAGGGTVLGVGADADAGPAVDAAADSGAPDAAADSGAPDAADSSAPDAAADSGAPDAAIAQPVTATSDFIMPLDVVTMHPPVAGTTPYGLAYLFNMACAGQVRFLPPNTSNSNPQQPPIGCFDEAGNALGSNDYVLGYTRVYSRAAPDGGYYENANPVIAGVHLPPCTLAVQGSVPSFVAPPIAVACTPSNCPNVTLGALVPQSSWEVNPLDLDSSGNPRHEEIWVDYYSTFGGFTGETRLLYDPNTGAVSGADTAFEPPTLGTNDVHDGFIFGIVYDDRGGESWVSIPTHVCSDPSDPACATPSCLPDGG